MTKDEIMQLDNLGLLEAVKNAYDITDDLERAEMVSYIQTRSEQIRAVTAVNTMLREFRKKQRKMEADISGGYKKIEPTVLNFLNAMRSSEIYDGVRYNVLKNRAEVHRDGIVAPWSDVDEAISREYIETNYGIYSDSKHSDALRMLFHERQYNPIAEIVNALKWDGVNRCEHFLTEWAKADDTAYTREVSRLIFAGGINRLYYPGCKFDDVPVLVGTKQGEGKSSLVRWLAINDEYFTDSITEMDGNKSVEQLDGSWICEVAELLALTKQKDQETAKSYITRAVDKIRRPYDKNITDYPRRCIFIGTTNNRQFLKDKTGNRRYYPVIVRSNGYWLYDHEQECRDYILQCWAEARERFFAGDMPNFANRDLLDKFKEAQEAATEDDWRVGVIEDYLASKRPGDAVCVKEIWDKALYPDKFRDINKKDSMEISQIINGIPGWTYGTRPYFAGYGQQRAWVKDGQTGCDFPPF